MSSFPLLNLPLVALRNVVDYWNPIDWYQFSKVSQKTKKITKSLSKPIGFVGLRSGTAYSITLNYRKPDLFRIRITDDKDDAYEFRIGEFEEHFMDEWPSWCNNPIILSVLSENPFVDVLHVIDGILEIFECQLTDVQISADGLTDIQFNYFITWSNSLKQQSIESVFLKTSNKQHLGDFLSSFKKSTGFLRTGGYNDKPPEFSDFHCHKIIDAPRAKWVGLKQLLAFDFVSCRFEKTALRNQDVNTFLKSWQNGKTHSRMEKCTLHIKNMADSRTILEGLSPEGLRRCGLNQQDCRVRRHDGKIARILFGEDSHSKRISIHLL